MKLLTNVLAGIKYKIKKEEPVFLDNKMIETYTKHIRKISRWRVKK